MRDEDLAFNKKKHLLFSKEVAETAKNYIEKNYPEKEAYMIWENIQHIYVDFLFDQPPIGDSKNGQRQGVYDCILLFALYEGLPKKPTVEEFEEIGNGYFCPIYERLNKFDLNKKWTFSIAKHLVNFVIRRNRNGREDFPDNYVMEPFDGGEGFISYKFYSCPIADFAKRHGYEFLMPAMCNPDYKMLSYVHAALVRTHTCGKDGDYCDYRMTGDKNPELKNHPLKKDEKGYLYNE